MDGSVFSSQGPSALASQVWHACQFHPGLVLMVQSCLSINVFDKSYERFSMNVISSQGLSAQA